MCVTLINPDSPFLIDPKVFPPLGILYLASVLEKESIETNVIDLAGIKDWKKEIEKIDSEIVGITCTTPQFPQAEEIRKSIKEINPSTKVVIGGPHPTVDHASCSKFDHIIIGEGEKAILNIGKKNC